MLGLDVEHRGRAARRGRRSGRPAAARRWARRRRTARPARPRGRAPRLVLVDLVDAGQRRRAADRARATPGRPSSPAPPRGRVRARSSRRWRSLPSLSDEQDVGDRRSRRPRRRRTPARASDDRRQFLGHGLGERQEAGAAPGGRDHCLANRAARHANEAIRRQCRYGQGGQAGPARRAAPGTAHAHAGADRGGARCGPRRSARPSGRGRVDVGSRVPAAAHRARLARAARRIGRAAASRVLVPVTLPDHDLDWVAAAGRRAARRRRHRCRRRGARAGAGGRRPTARGSGRGGGSYDRALARVPSATPVAALLYDGEVVVGLPSDAWDRPVGAVVTPSGGWRDLCPDNRPDWTRESSISDHG